MSDNNICRYCNGYENTAGFMHQSWCPMNRSTTTYYNVPLIDLHAEIASLRAALTGEERENKLCAESLEYWKDSALRATRERDEARKWARKMYQLARQLDGVLGNLNEAMQEYMAGIDIPWELDGE